MNNNKKYKKWSLGLVAPALVLAPIAVVASCSSSGEEKPAYGVTFTNNNEIKATIHKAVKPTALTDVQFKEEVLAHKSDLFTIEGTLPSDSFLNDNIEISDLKPSDDAKTVSAKVKLNKANTNGEAIEKTITLTKLGYEEVTLTNLKYTIAFKDEQSNPQEIELTGQGDVLVETLTAEKLIDLVLEKTNKDKILDITGDDAAKITDEVLANQILSATELTPAAAEGKITFKLSVEKPVNGEGNALEKTITFTGFKKETDSTPPAETEKFKIKFKDETEALDGVSDQSVSSITDGEKLKPIVIKNKDKIFEAEIGTLPGDDWWTEEKLTISKPTLNAADGSVTANISLDGFDTTDSASPDSNTLTKNNVVLKGFKKDAQTAIQTKELSTVTLGLNGTVAEAENDVNAKWVLEHKHLLFTKGFNLIENEADIKEVGLTAKTDKTKATLKFKVVANKWFSADGVLGTEDKEFTVNTLGFAGADTAGTKLRLKSNNPLEISLVDPELGKGTYDEFKNNSANIFTKDFVFKYRQHLLTGDFSLIKSADDLVKDGTVTVVPNDTGSKIQIQFKIPKEKVLPSNEPNDIDISIEFTGFATK